MPTSKNTFGQRHSRLANIAPESMTSYYVILTALSVIVGGALLYIDQTIVFAAVLAVLAVVLILAYPMFGLIIFVILSFIRPADMMPGLAVIPLAKIVGGTTLLSIIVSRIHSRDYEWGGRQAILLLLFAITLFISVPMSFWPSKSLAASQDFLKLILFYFLFVNIIRDLKSLRTISLVAVCCIAVLGLSTIYSYITGGGRAASIIGAGMFGDANDMALILVVALPLVAYWGIRRGKYPLYMLFQPMIIVILAVGVFLTQSRGGFLGLVAVTGLLTTIGRNKVIGISIFVMLALLAFVLLPSDFTDRYATISTYDEDASSMGRIYAWKAGLKMMVNRPVTGVGVGCFGTAFGLSYRPAGFNSGKWQSPHNTLIQVGGETGLIGLGLFVYLFYYTVQQMRKINPAGNEREKRDIRKIRNMLLVSLAGFGVCALFLTQAFSYLYYFLIASAASLYNINSRLALTDEAIEPANQN